MDLSPGLESVLTGFLVLVADEPDALDGCSGVLSHWVTLRERGSSPLPACSEATAAAVRGEPSRPTAASRWVTPDLATPVRAVTKS